MQPIKLCFRENLLLIGPKQDQAQNNSSPGENMKSIAALAAISTLVLLQAAPAVAQTEDAALEEIVVTAQRRQENLQDVPIAISAMTGQMLEDAGVRDPRDLQAYVPSLQFQSGTAATTTIIFLRGVGIGDFNSNTTGAVGVYVDDVFLGANAGKLFNVFDGEGVEVLRGPQGTLYGRNTTGGAIKFASRKPTNELSTDLSVLYGRYNEVRLEGGIGGPIVDDKLKIRVSGLYDKRDGWMHNRVTGHDLNDVDLWAARAIIDFTPTDSLLLRLSLHSGQNNGGARQFQHRGQGVGFDGSPMFDENGVPLDGMGYADTDHNVNAGDFNIEGKEKVKVSGGSLLGEFKLDGVTLTSITAYEKVDRNTLEDTDASPNDVLTAVYIDKPEQWSEELRAQSNGDGRLNWIAGAFFFDDDLETDSSFDVLRSLRPYFQSDENPTGFSPENSVGLLRYPYTQKTRSWALFGQTDYALTDAWNLTAGLRYTEDKIDFKYAAFFDEAGVGTFPVVSTDDSSKFTNTSGRLALSYKVSDDTLLYGSISSGYNSGGYPGGSAQYDFQLEPFDSEKLYAYEVGAKTELLDRRVRLNAAAFYYDYKDLQVFIYDTSGAIPVMRKLNAGSARIYGLEAELTVKPTAQLDAFVSISMLDSEYQNFVDGLGNDFSGNTLINAPEFSMSAGLTWTQPLGDAGSLQATAAGSYQSKVYLTPDNSKAYSQDPVTLLNARLAWTPPGGGFEVALWGKNLTDERWVNFMAPIITMDQLNYNDPETYGIEFSYHTK
jgi:iron complex outermembrane receptor protein